MNILWVGAINWFTGEDYVMEPHTAGAVSTSAFEQAIIQGIEDLGHNVRILSDWDNDKGKRFEWSHNGIQTDVTVSGISIKYLRLLYKADALYKEIKSNPCILDRIDFVLIYSVHIPYFYLLKRIKSINPNIKIVLICPDLSEYMDPSIKKKPFKMALRRIESRYIHKQCRWLDGVVWFAEKMNEIMKVEVPSVVVEGVFSSSNIDMRPVKYKNNSVVYAGSLNLNFGIQNIVKAFCNMKDINIELHIFGTGEMEKELELICRNEANIKCEGFVDRRTLFEYEKSAMMLINARDPNEEYTKYSFPSKMFEYMVSGTPVLTTRLEGIPNEYYRFVDVLEDNSAQTIERHIRKWYRSSEDDRISFGNKAKEFVLNNKTSYEQSKKICDFMEKISEL